MCYRGRLRITDDFAKHFITHSIKRRKVFFKKGYIGFVRWYRLTHSKGEGLKLLPWTWAMELNPHYLTHNDDTSYAFNITDFLEHVKK